MRRKSNYSPYDRTPPGSSPAHVVVRPRRNEHIDRAIKRFLKKVKNKRIIEDYNVKVVGIHQHTGSGLSDEDDFYQGITFLTALIDLFPDLKIVKVGGGIGVPYREGQKSIDDKDHELHCTRCW